jgi:hypothetical protein
LGKPPKAKVWPKPEEAMNNPQLAAVLDDASPVVAPQPEKVVAEAKAAAESAVDPSSTLRSGKITSHAIGVEVVAQERKVEALDEVRNVGNGTDAEVLSPAAKDEVERGSDRGREGEREYHTYCIP